MKVTINDQNETRKDVIVTIDADSVSAEESKIVKQFMKEVRVRGFRPGKVPENRVRALYGKEIGQEMKRSLMNLALKAIGDEKIEIASVVDFPEPDVPLAGQEVNLDLTVDINPEFELPQYEGLEVEVPSAEVSDAEVDEAIDRLRRQRADFVVVERAAAVEDYVKVSYTGTLDGESLEAVAEENPSLRAWVDVKEGWEEAGTEEAKQYGVPAIIDAIVGMSADETKTVEQVIPENFPKEDLRDKTVSYELTVHEVRERKLPEIDEDFLKTVNAESLEDFKAQVLDQLEDHKKSVQRQAKHEGIGKILIEAVDIPLPESSIERERQQAMGRILSRSYQQGMAPEELEKHKGDIYESATEAAKRDVKLHLIFSRIAEKENIELSNEDMTRAIYAIASQQKQKVEDIVKDIKKDPERLRELQLQVLLAKTSELVAEKAVEKIISA